jgi:Mor family transcriptional regulator
MPLPEKTRRNRELIRYWLAGESYAALAKRFNISISRVYGVIRRFYLNGNPRYNDITRRSNT